MSETTFPTYKGKPMVRCGSTIYYGNMKDAYVAKLDIKTTKTIGDLDVADKILIQLIATDPTIPPSEMIDKTAERQGLYDSLDIADIWLTKKLSENA